MIVHSGAGQRTLTIARSATLNGQSGYWLQMQQIQFGLAAIEANAAHVIANHEGSYEVPSLRAINPLWRRSVFVNVGNPHCVTFLDSLADLPSNEVLGATELFRHLQQISFRPEPSAVSAAVFRAGANLQWIWVDRSRSAVHGRVFERGEGPTASSGTSATAIAAASKFLGLTDNGLVEVVMPGGTAYVDIEGQDPAMSARFFGRAERC